MSLENQIALQFRVQQFLNQEAHLLDTWAWDEWLKLFAEDIRYWMPLRKNLLRRERGSSQIPTQAEMALFDDNFEQLSMRVQQMLSGRHWAEDPPSRTRHLVTNVVVDPAPAADRTISVRSNFIVYRNRMEREVDIWAGCREDLLRTEGDQFLIARRTILLDQNVVLSKNLSVFF